MSQAELAKAIGLHQSPVGRWEVGEGSPSMQQGLALARALGVPYDYLADDSMRDAPGPLVSPDEAAVIQLMRALKLDRDEALRRLATPPIPTGPLKGGPAQPIPFEELTDLSPVRRPKGGRS